MNHSRFFAAAVPVTLEQVLDNRERRARFQAELWEKHRKTLVSFTLNIPGEYKRFSLADKTFATGTTRMAELLGAANIPIIAQKSHTAHTGCEQYYVIDVDGTAAKKIFVGLEESHPLGRLFDIDVIGGDGQMVKGAEVGREERTCLLCGKPVWACARSRAHSAEELACKTAEMMEAYFTASFADQISKLAVKALLYEVAISPKPGLVDRRNNGSHHDMNLFTFLDSSCELIPFFRDITLKAARSEQSPADILPHVRHLGVEAEHAMNKATGGINTHKGAIFSLGMLCTAQGCLFREDVPVTAERAAELCATIARGTLTELTPGGDALPSHGQMVYEAYSYAGIRGEVAAGFPHVRGHSLPVLTAHIAAGLSVNDAAVIALLHLIAHVDDTNIIHRSSGAELREIQATVRGILHSAQSTEELLQAAHELDDLFIRKNISPGGCADLLAITLFLYWVEAIK